MSLIDNKNDIKNIITTYTKHWKWFVLAAIAALVMAFINIRYTIPEYGVTSQIQVVQDKNSTSELSLFKELDVFSGGSKQVEDEIQILGSRANFIDVVKELGTNISFMALGNIIDSEIYGAPPVKLSFMASDSVINRTTFSFFIEFTSETRFSFAEAEDLPAKEYTFGDAVPSTIGDIIITPNVKNPKGHVGKRYQVSITPVERVAGGL